MIACPGGILHSLHLWNVKNNRTKYFADVSFYVVFWMLKSGIKHNTYYIVQIYPLLSSFWMLETEELNIVQNYSMLFSFWNEDN